MGSGYGPVVVAREPLSLDELRESEIVVPGALTTAFLVLGMALGADVRAAARCRSTGSSTRSRRARREAGLVIHEGQLTYADEGLAKCVDLGEWWLLETGLPLPLGVNVVRRDLGDDDAAASSRRCCASRSTPGSRTATRRSSTRSQFGRGLDGALADRFVGMYVNELTQDYGDEGRAGGRRAAARAAEAIGRVRPVPGPRRVRSWR